ncbi:MAG: hypothetical protein BGN87_18450 [Rhizobiales bacterium 65-79]|nr:MAG: hypothetical protein BGN87_18450 [Rhizobiales bacterium 65-79]
MSLRVITPPAPIVDTTDLLIDDSDGLRAVLVIAAVTEMIDGPTGWLGRALGPQTLEYSGWFGHCHIRLPCPPIIKIVGVFAVDKDGVETEIDAGDYRLDDDCLIIADGTAWDRCEKHRIRYKAGYNGMSGAAEGELQTGDVPARAQQAIILAAQHMINTGSENLFLSVDEVEGIGRKQYVVSDAARATIEATCDRLLMGLRVFA